MIEENVDVELAVSILKILSKFDPKVLSEAIRTDPELINKMKIHDNIDQHQSIEW